MPLSLQGTPGLAAAASAALMACAARGAPQVATPAPAPAQPASQSLGLSTARFAPAAPLPASAFLYREPAPNTPAAPGDFPLRPVFTAGAPRHTAAIPIPKDASLYGLADTPGPLLRNGSTTNPPGLRTVLFAVAPGGATTTIIADTAATLEVSLADQVLITGDAAFPVIISLAESPLDAAITLSNLTGRLEMPPRWALGAQVWSRTAAASPIPAGASLWITPPGLAAIAAPDLATRTGLILPASLTKQLTQTWPELAAANRRSGITGITLRFTQDFDPLAARDLVRQSRLALAPSEEGPRPFVQASDAPLTLQSLGGTLLFGSTPEASISAALSTALSGESLVGFGPACRENPETLLLGLCAMPLAAIPAELASSPREDIRAALAIRRQLTPYLYTLTFNAFFLGEPIIRPVFFADPRHPALRATQDSFLLGPDLLVTIPDHNPPAALADWPILSLGPRHRMLPTLRLRPGAILPAIPPGADPNQQITALALIVSPAPDHTASGALYEDDGDGYGLFKNQARRTGYSCERRDNAYLLRLSFLDGGWPLPERPVHVRILTPAADLTAEGTERGTIRIPIPPTPATP